MQPKFTQQRLGYFCTRIIALTLIFSASAQFSFAQQNPANENTLTLDQFQKLKTTQKTKPVQQVQNAKAGIVKADKADNDAGLPNRAVSSLMENPMGICTTITGSLAPGDLTMTNRLNRNGVQGICPGPKPFAPSLTGNTYYDLHTWTNTTGLVQCATFTLTTTDVTTNIEFGVYSGPFNPANLATNFFTDPGLSSGTPPVPTICFANVGIGQTLTFVVFTPNAALQTASNYTLTVDMPVGCAAGPPCSWSASTVYPIPVLDQAAATVGTNLYSFTGVSNGALVTNSYVFNGTIWTPIAAFPVATEFPTAVSDGSNVYIVGGFAGGSLTTLRRYNVASNTYTTLAPSGTGTWNQAAVYLNGKIYKITGFTGAGGGTATNAVEIYDIASNTWSAGAPYPLGVGFVGAWAQGGYVYTAGGTSPGGVESTKTYRYDPGTNTWDDAAIADMPATRWGSASEFYNNGGIMAGGYSANVIVATALQWDQASNTWSALPNMLTNRSRMAGAVLSGSFHVIGGRNVNNFIGTNNNQKLFCIPPTPCTGTPAPGNTISSINPVCSGVSFTLSLQNNPFLSGFTYQWQSSLTGVPASFANIAGATGVTYSTTQTVATYYRCIVTCTPSALSGTSNPVLVADGQGVFNTHPVNASTQCSGNTSFSFTATGASLVYAWEYRINASSPWLNVTNGGVYSGATTNTLTLTGVPSTYNGYQYRGLISGPCTAVDFSNVATLTVTPLVATVNVTSPVTICTGTIQTLTLTNATSPATTTFPSGPLSIVIPDGLDPAPNPPPVCATGVNHTIPVALPAGSQITRIDLRLNITHTYASDLVIVLKNSTTNEVMNLFYHKSGAQTAGANFTNTVISSVGTQRFSAVPPPFTGTFRADQEIGAGSYGDANGSGPTAFQPTTTSWNTLWGGVNQGSGNWTIAICDPYEWRGDFGTLTSWSMDITYGAPAAGIWTQASPASPNSMFTDPAATIAYTGTLENTIYVRPLATAPFTGNSATYCVVFSTTSPACTSNPTCVTVNVTSPITGLTTPANKTACVGTNTSFSVSPGGGPLTYQWEVSVNNGITWSTIAGATAATLNLTAVTQLMNNNLYRVTVTAAPCGSSTTAAAILKVLQLPVVTISSTTLQLVPGRVATITGTITGPSSTSPLPLPFSATSWSWTLNGSPVPITPSLNPAVNTNTLRADIDNLGAYQATVTDNQILIPASPLGGCTNSSNIVTIGSEASDRLWIYPNPNLGQFQVRLYYSGVQAERRIVRIYNMLGQLVAQKEFDLVLGTAPYLRLDFDLGMQSAGTYVVKVVDANSKKITSGLVVIQ